MKDKADAIVKGHLKPRLSYYISPLWIKIAIVIFLLFILLETFELV